MCVSAPHTVWYRSVMYPLPNPHSRASMTLLSSAPASPSLLGALVWPCTAFVHEAATSLGSGVHRGHCHRGGATSALPSLLRPMGPQMAWFRCCGCSTTLPATLTRGATNGPAPLPCTWSPGMLMCLTSWIFARTQERRNRCVCECSDNWNCRTDIGVHVALCCVVCVHCVHRQRARDLFYGLWIPDLFMKRVEADKDWSLMCPHECPGLHEVWGEEFEQLYEKCGSMVCLLVLCLRALPPFTALVGMSARGGPSAR